MAMHLDELRSDLFKRGLIDTVFCGAATSFVGGVVRPISEGRSHPMGKGLVVLAILALFARISHACTVCDSVAGSALRAGIFDDSFSITFLQVAAPFLVVGLTLYALDRCLPADR